MRGVVFNGKFYAQSTTGVQRVARRLIAATSALVISRLVFQAALAKYRSASS